MRVSRNPLFLLVLAIGLCTAYGCGGGGGGTGVASGTTSVPAAPDAAVKQIAEELSAGRPQVLWHALPASYQNDLTSVVHLAAERMDGEMWNQTFSVLGKVTQLLSEKREFIFQHPMLAAQLSENQELTEGWDDVVGLLDDFTHSELADLEKVQNLDVESFLAGTGGHMMARIQAMSDVASNNEYGAKLDKLSRMQATVISEDGKDAAIVRLEVEGEQSVDERFVRVEGKWIPERFANEWESTISGMRLKIVQISTGMREDENRAAVLMQLSMVEGALDRVIASESAEEFNAGMGAAMGMFVGAAMSQGGQTGMMGGGAPIESAAVTDPASSGP